MDITLSIEQQEEAKELLKKLTELYRARVELESIKAGRIEKLQYEVAGELDLKNKNGDVEPKLVKAKLAKRNQNMSLKSIFLKTISTS